MAIKGGKLYEIHGNHCSCYGLEDQWNPERVVIKELRNRFSNGTQGVDCYGENKYREEIRKFLGLNSDANKNNENA